VIQFRQSYSVRSYSSLAYLIRYVTFWCTSGVQGTPRAPVSACSDCVYMKHRANRHNMCDVVMITTCDKTTQQALITNE